VVDDADRAQVLEEAEREMGIQEVLQQNKNHQIVINDEVICQSCYLPVPDERVEAYPDCTRCIGCQTRYEKQKRMQHYG